MLEACIQVLHRLGPARLTTTAVAERAGVSVGTLYQYFPNKRALLAAVLRQHLTAVANAVADAATKSMGRSQRDVVAAVVAAFIEAKFADVKTSRVLYAVAADVGGPAIVRASAESAREALATALASAPDADVGDASADLGLVSGMLVSMMIGPVQDALEAGTSRTTPAMLCRELTVALVGYLAYRRPAPA